MYSFLFLAFIGFITGLIDAIAGGGGLISVPAYMVVLGPTVEAVATNKVSAVASTLAALFIYRKKGFIDFKNFRFFLAYVFIGSVTGALSSSLMPALFYKIMPLVLIPLILFVLFQRHLWKETPRVSKPKWVLVLLGFICGFYDGIAGPGGGTLMFLSLFVFGGVPLYLSIGTAKLANVVSASSSFTTYLYLGKINWWVSIPATITIIIGALIGARFATKNAALYGRIALVVVSALLMAKMIYEWTAY